MSAESPLTLYELAFQSLIESEASCSTHLQDLPTQIFHEVFVEAFIEERYDILTVMVQAWPFRCLPLKTLMDLRKLKKPRRLSTLSLWERNKQALVALLDGIDMQLSQKAPHSRWKLQVLDWRDVHQDFWTVGPRALSAAHSEDTGHKDTGKPRKRATLEILAHVYFFCLTTKISNDYELQVYLLKWAKKRKASVRMCIEKVIMEGCLISDAQKCVRAVHPGSIRELHMVCHWRRDRMKAFMPQLQKMRNLHTLCLSGMSPTRCTSPSLNRWYSRMYAFHLAQIPSLRELYVDDAFFLQGTLRKIFCSETRLEVLSLSSSPLKESDLQHLSQYPGTSQLKSLALSKIEMDSFNPETLRVLLDPLVHTLEHLALQHCGITDSRLLAILPALSRCSQLKTFSCYGNPISLGALMELLQVSAGLSQLSKGLYPAPLESYPSIPGYRITHSSVNPEKCHEICAELAGFLKDIRPSLRVIICFQNSDIEPHRLNVSGKWEVTEEDITYVSVKCKSCLDPEHP